MSNWSSRLRRSGLALGVGALALGATAGTALAAGTAITGSGSSLQALAQSQTSPRGWDLDWTTKSSLTGESATYTSSSSGAGLARFALTSPATSLPSGALEAFVGTDDPPNSTLIANSRSASGTTPVTVPVASAPVAILVSLPTTLTTTSTSIRLTNVLLAQAYSGNVAAAGGFARNTWGALLTTAGATGVTDSNSSDLIGVEVRAGTSGTTETVQKYLNRIDPTDFTVTDGSDTWPTGTNLVGVANNGGGAEVLAVASTPGTIGYANLADAVSTTNGPFSHTLTASRQGTGRQRIAYALIQNNGTAVSSPAPTYADPIDPVIGGANARAGSSGSWSGFPTGTLTAATSWDGTTANNNAVGSETESGVTVQRYPIQAPTYDIGWDDYTVSGLSTHYANQTNTDQTARDFFAYLVDGTGFASNGGQTLLNPTGTNLIYYTALPSTILALAQQEAAFVG